MTAPSPPSCEVERYYRRLLCVACLFQLLLMLATNPLWLSNSDFPVIPLVDLFATVPKWCDQMILGIFILAVIATLAVSAGVRRLENDSSSRVLAYVVVFSGLTLGVMNQHRFQAWHCLFLTLIAIDAIVSAGYRLFVCRLAVAMIYICAALSRFGPNIEAGMSRELVDTALRLIGLRHLMQHDMLVSSICVMMTLSELAVGLALVVHKTRRCGLFLGIVLHGSLLLLLSPVGMNHHNGVLLWNSFFVVFLFVFLLAEKRVTGANMQQSRSAIGPRRHLPTVLVAGWVVLFPLSGLVGGADNWPSWQLYSPRPEVLRVFVHIDAKQQLPDSIQPMVGAPAPLDVWCPVRIDRWSLAETYSAIYPQDRFQLSVAARLARSLENPAMLRAVLDSPSVPDWWNRSETEFSDGHAIQNAAEVR